MLDAAKEWARRRVVDMILDGGELVPADEYKARMLICNGCPKMGLVKVKGLEFQEGCTVCGCPLETKARMKQINNVVLQKILNTEHIFCPHPEGDKWAEINSNI